MLTTELPPKCITDVVAPGEAVCQLSTVHSQGDVWGGQPHLLTDSILQGLNLSSISQSLVLFRVNRIFRSLIAAPTAGDQENKVLTGVNLDHPICMDLGWCSEGWPTGLLISEVCVRGCHQPEGTRKEGLVCNALVFAPPACIDPLWWLNQSSTSLTGSRAASSYFMGSAKPR